jgi:release factor glutamine methyltransferase
MSPHHYVPALTSAPTRAEALREARATVALGNAAAQADLERLLAFALGISRTELMLDPLLPVNADAMQRFLAVAQRRAAGEPFAYIVGEREFWSLGLRVTPDVLVPRPETELLVQGALSLVTSSDANVIDLGTGSGAVALAIASERPRWRVVATDASEAALAVARGNAARHRLDRVEFLHSHWWQAMHGCRFDLVVSNPPYIARNDAVLDSDGLRFEPLQALAAGTTGLEDLAEIIAGAASHLNDNGHIVFEHGSIQGPWVREQLVAQGFNHVRSHLDLAGHERVTMGSWRSKG